MTCFSPFHLLLTAPIYFEYTLALSNKNGDHLLPQKCMMSFFIVERGGVYVTAKNLNRQNLPHVLNTNTFAVP